MRIVYCFDMDGVLAKWNPAASIEDTMSPGYFLDREPDMSAIECLKILRESNDPSSVFILSSVYPNGYAAKEKMKWLEKYGICDTPLFIPYGENKSKYVSSSSFPVLIDDYTRNLKEWEWLGLAIKYRNGVNGTHGTWTGNAVDYRMSPEDMALTIQALGEAYAKRK